MPDRADKVLNQIESVHGGSLNDSRFGTRMKGEGEFADQVKQQFKIARAKYLKGRERPLLNCDLHEKFKDGQMKLFWETLVGVKHAAELDHKFYDEFISLMLKSLIF